ncbi:MAG TPA: tetratricopeptide repeat protein [Oceanobacillus sp.]|nr:tetratricopeptide repeat protein [Oceanobacillus sp.]
MNWIERLSSLFRSNISPALLSQPSLDAGRHAKFAEDYAGALEALDRALASNTSDPAPVHLQRADVLMCIGRYDEAAAAIEAAKRSLSSTMRSYALSMSGWLAQTQGDWATARTCYEQALDEARSVKAISAEGRAMSHLADTYLHDGNASYAAHLLREALPKLTMPSDVEMSSYFVGLLGQALIQNGQETEGHHLIRRALGLAEQIGYRRYLRLWSIVMGERAADEARFFDAKTHLSRALDLFKEASPEQVKTLCQMSKVCLALREHDEALAHAQKAVELSDSLNDEPTTLAARGALGVALRAVGQSAEAVPHLQAAADGLGRSDVLRALAAAQADSGDRDAAITTYQKAIQQAQAADSPLEIAGARRDLGLVFLKDGQLPAAIQEWTAALALYEEQKAHSQLARLYCDIANARKALGQTARAMKDYEQALMELNSVEEYDLETRGLVLSNAANAYVDQGDVESADAFFTESISIATRTGDKAAESTRNGNYGYFLLTVGRPRRAISTLERALRTSQSLGLKLQQAIQTDNLGLAYDSLADYEIALTHHTKALELVEELNQPYWKAIIRVNLANTLIALARLVEAQPHIDEALEYGRSSENNEVLVRALTATALLAVQQGKPADAEAPLNEAIALARRAEMRRWLADALSVRSQQQALLQQMEQANAAWEEAARLYGMLRMPQAKYAPAWLTGR